MLAHRATVTTARLLSSASEGTIARSLDFLEFKPAAPAFMLLDIDRKGMPQAVADRIDVAGGVVQLLTELFPALMKGARVERASTSAGIVNTASGETFARSGGMHIYVLVADGSDIPRTLATLNDWLWLNKCGWCNVGAVGQILIRSLVDASVGSPERLVFEGAAIVKPPLEQDLEARRPIVVADLLLIRAELFPHWLMRINIISNKYSRRNGAGLPAKLGQYALHQT